MPELPEVEFARSVIERAALHRSISDVDDTDAYVCRPHRAGDIRSALVGRTLTAAHRRGKTMWCDTDGGPVLGIHLVGARVGELIAEAQLIYNWEAVPADVAQLIHPHPTQSEAIGEAHLALAGKPLHVHE